MYDGWTCISSQELGQGTRRREAADLTSEANALDYLRTRSSWANRTMFIGGTLRRRVCRIAETRTWISTQIWRWLSTLESASLASCHMRQALRLKSRTSLVFQSQVCVIKCIAAVYGRCARSAFVL